jgi:DNA mismatch repair ATPase MutS
MKLSEELWFEDRTHNPPLIHRTQLVRPEFTGTLAIKSGRHPILENVKAAGTVVPNDVYCSDAAYFQIIQGPKLCL